jgi:hypothetical protein
VDAHEIRLRGGWECAAPDESTSGTTRLTLPAPIDSLPAGRVRLTRRFNRPPRVESGPVVLRLLQAPGIRSVLLNGRPMGPISPACPDLELELGTLAPRNELVIEAEPRGPIPPWGAISLVFRSM